MFKKVVAYFDRLEDKIRARLSRMPIVYALVGAVGIILVWKGVWESAEHIPALWGPGSILLGVLILLTTGLLVSFFIGDNILMSGFKRDKKLFEKSEKEILAAEKTQTAEILAKLNHLEQDIHAITGEERSQSPQEPQLPLR